MGGCYLGRLKNQRLKPEDSRQTPKDRAIQIIGLDAGTGLWQDDAESEAGEPQNQPCKRGKNEYIRFNRSFSGDAAPPGAASLTTRSERFLFCMSRERHLNPDMPTAPYWMKEMFFGQPCRICRRPNDIQIDHIIPRFKGGKTVPENLQPLCQCCNQLKDVNKNNDDVEKYWRQNPQEFVRRQNHRTRRRYRAFGQGPHDLLCFVFWKPPWQIPAGPQGQ